VEFRQFDMVRSHFILVETYTKGRTATNMCTIQQCC